MHRIFIALLFSFGFAVPALADGRAFPPDGCSPAVPFMAFNGVNLSGNTYCIDGQSVLSNALPGCGPDQIVSFNGTGFYCKDAPAETEEAQVLTIPNCGSGEVLTGSGGNLTCVAQSSGADSGTLCGLGYRSCTPGFGCGPFISIATCKGSPVMSSAGIKNQPYKFVPSCPTGYTISTPDDSDSIEAGPEVGFRTCVKN